MLKVASSSTARQLAPPYPSPGHPFLLLIVGDHEVPGPRLPGHEASGLARPSDSRRDLPRKITAQGWARAPIASATRAQRAPLTVNLARRQDARREEDGQPALAGVVTRCCGESPARRVGVQRCGAACRARRVASRRKRRSRPQRRRGAKTPTARGRAARRLGRPVTPPASAHRWQSSWAPRPTGLRSCTRTWNGSSSCSAAPTAGNSSAHDQAILPGSRGYAGPCGPQRRSSSRCALRALHVDPRRGTGVHWHLSGKPAHENGSDRP